MLLSLLAAASAAEPPPLVAEEVVVEGRRLDDAREAMRGRLEELGYVRVLGGRERSWFVNRAPWKPTVMVHEQGFARIRTLPILPLGAGLSVDGGVAEVPGMATGLDAVEREEAQASVSFLALSPRERRSARGRLAETLEPYLREVRDATWALARAQREVDLRAELVGIWFDGVDAAGGTLATPEARREALVERWLATAPDASGEWAREVVEAFVDDEVQPVAPYTEVEIDAADARATFERRFRPLASP